MSRLTHVKKVWYVPTVVQNRTVDQLSLRYPPVKLVNKLCPSDNRVYVCTYVCELTSMLIYVHHMMCTYVCTYRLHTYYIPYQYDMYVHMSRLSIHICTYICIKMNVCYAYFYTYANRYSHEPKQKILLVRESHARVHDPS